MEECFILLIFVIKFFYKCLKLHDVSNKCNLSFTNLIFTFEQEQKASCDGFDGLNTLSSN